MCIHAGQPFSMGNATHKKSCCLNPKPRGFHATGRQLSTPVMAPSGSSVRPGGVFTCCFQHSTTKWKSQGSQQLSIGGFQCKEPKAAVMKQSQMLQGHEGRMRPNTGAVHRDTASPGPLC